MDKFDRCIVSNFYIKSQQQIVGDYAKTVV